MLRMHLVKPGENLSTIAEKYYGNGCKAHALAIYQANRAVIADPNNVYPGQHLAIPHIAVRAYG